MTDLQEFNPVPSETTPQKAGCFLFTLPGCLISCFVVSIVVCCLLIAVFFVGTSAIIALLASNEVSMSGTETFVLESGQVASLSIDDPNITLNILGSDTNQIKVDYVLHEYALSKGEAQQNLDKITVSIERQADNQFVITVDDEGTTVFSYYELDVTMQVPREMSQISITSQQDITIENVSAVFDLNSEYSSDIVLRDVGGEFNVAVLGQSAIQFSGYFSPNTSNYFTSATGDITLNLRDTPDLAYVIRTSASGQVICPDTTERSQQCRNTVGMASRLEATSSGGDITLTIE